MDYTARQVALIENWYKWWSDEIGRGGIVLPKLGSNSDSSTGGEGQRPPLPNRMTYAIVMLLVAVIGVAIAGAELKRGAVYADPVIDDRALAESFLRSYYAETVADPHKCCYSRLSGHL
jgi:hypothetical protein